VLSQVVDEQRAQRLAELAVARAQRVGDEPFGELDVELRLAGISREALRGGDRFEQRPEELHIEVALGVSEGPLQPAGERPDREGGTALAGAGECDAVAQVTAYALNVADRRGAGGVGTRDLLMAVMRIYGDAFDRVLRAHGTDRHEVLERLGAPANAAESQP